MPEWNVQVVQILLHLKQKHIHVSPKRIFYLLIPFHQTTGDEHRVKPSDFKRVEWLFPETTKNFERLPLQYRGYCGWALVRFDRLLLPGNPDIGVLRYNDRYYVFSSKEAAYEFASDPNRYIQHVAECAKISPELIQLLELHAQFATITPYTQDKDQGQMIEKPITKCDMGVQTEVHPIESNIVKSYEWNEWELRRKAIQLTNLRNKVTHSMQTNLSNLRRDNVTQVYLPKDTASQTKTDGFSNVPKPQTFLAGLRGGQTKTTVMTKVDLTLDVDQT